MKNLRRRYRTADDTVQPTPAESTGSSEWETESVAHGLNGDIEPNARNTGRASDYKEEPVEWRIWRRRAFSYACDAGGPTDTDSLSRRRNAKRIWPLRKIRIRRGLIGDRERLGKRTG